MNLSEIIQAFGSNIWIYGGAFVLVLSVLVFIHEWGHYIVARLCGVRVEVFSIGFGKELFGFNDKKGTRWKFSLVPLGGYVKLFGDVDPASAGHTDEIEDEENGIKRPMTEAERNEAFFTKSVAKRAAIVFAGPAINYIFAFMIFALLFTFHGQLVSPPVAAAVSVDSAADEYGFMPHDRVISIDGKHMDSFADIRREMLLALDIERTFKIERNGEEVEIKARPERVETTDRFGFKSSIGRLGIYDPERSLVQITKIIKINDTEFKLSEDADDSAKQQLQDQKIAMLNELMENNTVFAIGIDRGTMIDTLLIQPSQEHNQNMANPEDKMYFGLLYLANAPPREVIKLDPASAIIKAGKECYVLTRNIIEALGQMVMGVRSATELGGIIRIGALAGDMAQQGFIALVFLTALLSINLGFVNLLPIPLLDGGHLLFYFFEAVMGKPVPEQIQEYAFRFGLVFLIGVMAFANLNDILQMLPDE